jgi:hypothetical protein
VFLIPPLPPPPSHPPSPTLLPTNTQLEIELYGRGHYEDDYVESAPDASVDLSIEDEDWMGGGEMFKPKHKRGREEEGGGGRQQTTTGTRKRRKEAKGGRKVRAIL